MTDWNFPLPGRATDPHLFARLLNTRVPGGAWDPEVWHALNRELHKAGLPETVTLTEVRFHGTDWEFITKSRSKRLSTLVTRADVTTSKVPMVNLVVNYAKPFWESEEEREWKTIRKEVDSWNANRHRRS